MDDEKRQFADRFYREPERRYGYPPFELLPRPGDRTCRGCGCTESRACVPACSWVLVDLDEATGVCSVCADHVGYDTAIMFQMNRDPIFPKTPIAMAVAVIFCNLGVVDHGARQHYAEADSL